MQFLVGWLLLWASTLAAPESAAGHASGECEGETCATREDAADEAGLLQVKSPAEGGSSAFPDTELEGEDAPAEVVRKMALIDETGDPMPTYKVLPEGLQSPLDSLGAQINSNAGSGAKLVAHCDFTQKTDCPMAGLKTTGFTGIFPNTRVWKTACMNSSSKFMFQVYPGHKDKLLVYFQDGGACWDPLSASLPYSGTRGVCSQEVNVAGTTGIFNRKEPKNPYKDHTIVHVNYCSGDAHAGNAVHFWAGTWMVQAGYNNSLAAIEWAKQNVAAKLQHLSIMGASAGSLGAQVWSRTLLTEFKSGGRSYASATVLSDSYLGVFPENTQPYVLSQIFRVCDLPLGKGWSKPCGGDLTLQDAFVETMKMFPDVAFAMINSKGDTVQSGFFSAIALTLTKKIVILPPDLMYKVMTSILHRYNEAPNFVVFQVEGTHHVFAPKARCGDNVTECAGDVYDARPSGPLAEKVGQKSNAAADEPLVDWLDELVNKRGAVQSRCYGTPRQFSETKPFPTGLCDMKMQGKRLRLRAARR